MPGGLGDVGAAAVIERERERERVVGPCQRLAFLHQGGDLARERAAIAYHAQADVVLVQVRDLAAQIALEQPHQIHDLAARALPVLRRETEQGDV